jgi:hypothetical protein
MTFARRLIAAADRVARVPLQGGDIGLFDCREVYLEGDDSDPIDLIEQSECGVDPSGCVYLTHCGKITCICCGRAA